MIYRGSIAWFIFCLTTAGLAGYVAYLDPEKFSGVVDLLATIISILIGVSLAIIAVLTSPFSVSEKAVSDGDEAGRMTELIRRDEEKLASGQLMFFWIFFGALALSLSFSWATSGDDIEFDILLIKILACVTAAVGVFAFLWSARLPLMLQKISSQRQSLG